MRNARESGHLGSAAQKKTTPDVLRIWNRDRSRGRVRTVSVFEMVNPRASGSQVAIGAGTRPVPNVPVLPGRLRVVETRRALAFEPIRPDELFDTAVLVKADACHGDTTVQVVNDLLPWMHVWRDHDLWRSGAWRCQVGGPGEFTAERSPLLKFHTDMSRRPLPPAYTVIRCLEADRGGGGGSLLIHIDDALARLEQRGDADLLAILRRERTLNATEGVAATAALVSSHQGRTLARIFDAGAATKGLHLDLSPDEVAALAHFVDLCHTWADLTIRPAVGDGDLLAFSNHTFMHAREACVGSRRVTEIVLGNGADAPSVV
jgi:hypothetical protein